MDAIDCILNRVSIARLGAPAPSKDDRQIIFKAALRAADHGNLQPWRFLVIEGEGLQALGELYVKAAENAEPTLSDAQRDRFLNMPQRAPMIIVAIAHLVAHPKVPEIEQVISAGAAVQNMLNAAYALDVGAFWRSGEFAYSKEVQKGLGLTEHEQIVGFLYVGTPLSTPEMLEKKPIESFFSRWPL